MRSAIVCVVLLSVTASTLAANPNDAARRKALYQQRKAALAQKYQREKTAKKTAAESRVAGHQSRNQVARGPSVSSTTSQKQQAVAGLLMLGLLAAAAGQGAGIDAFADAADEDFRSYAEHRQRERDHWRSRAEREAAAGDLDDAESSLRNSR